MKAGTSVCNFLISAVVTVITLTIFLQPVVIGKSIDLKKHVPRFTWRTNADGEKCIYDGDMLVARLFEGPHLTSFHDVKLVPGGPVFIKRDQRDCSIALAWRKTGFFNMKIDELTVNQDNPQRLKLYAKLHDIGVRDGRDPEFETWKSAFIEQTWIELTYDPDLGSYVFDVHSSLQLRPGREEAALKRDYKGWGFEYMDLLPDKCFDLFAPNGEKKFQWFVYTGGDGKLYKLPHTHHVGVDKLIESFGKDGILAFVVDSEYNPVVRFAGETALATHGGICAWAWDFHFRFRKEEQSKLFAAGRPLTVHYQVYSVPEKQASKMLAKAILAPILDDPIVHVPPYIPGAVNTFKESNDYRQPCDVWFWRKSETYCIWDLENGYKSKGCISIDRQSPKGSSIWRVTIGSPYPPQPKLKGRIRIKAMIRTKDVAGAVRLGWFFYRPAKGANIDGKYDLSAIEYSKELTGTNDWTEVVLLTSETGGSVIGELLIEQKGAGKTWIDNVEIIY